MQLKNTVKLETKGNKDLTGKTQHNPNDYSKITLA